MVSLSRRWINDLFVPLNRGAGRLRSRAPLTRLRLGDEPHPVAVGEGGAADRRLPFGQGGRHSGHFAHASRQRFPQEGHHIRHVRHRSSSSQGQWIRLCRMRLVPNAPLPSSDGAGRLGSSHGKPVDLGQCCCCCHHVGRKLKVNLNDRNPEALGCTSGRTTAALPHFKTADGRTISGGRKSPNSITRAKCSSFISSSWK